MKLIKFKQWVKKNHIQTLNIAGPREDGSGVYALAKIFLKKCVLKTFKRQRKIPV